jgi:hypothetical protein
MPFKTDETNDAGGMTHIPVMLYRLMDQRGHGHADATHIYTNTMHGDMKRRLKTMTHNGLIGGAL